MNVSDFSAKVNSERDKYNKAATRLREDYKSNAENQASAHELKQEKQADNYVKNTREQEDTLNKLSDHFVEKTRDGIKDRQERYNNELGVRRNAFEEENRRLRNNMSEKLDTLRSEYNKNMYEKEKNQEGIVSDLKDRYRKGDLKRKGEFDASMNEVQNKSKQTFKDYTEAEAAEKNAMIAGYRDEIQNTIVDNNQKSNQKSNKHQETLEQLRKSFDNEKESLHAYQQGTNEQLRFESKENMNQMRDNFESLTDNLTTRNNHDKKKLINDNKKSLLDLETQFEKDRHDLNRKTNSMALAASSTDSGRAELNRLKNNQMSQMQHLRQAMSDQKAIDQLSKEQVEETSREALNSQKVAALEAKDNYENDFSNSVRQLQNENRRGKVDLIEQYSKQLQNHDLNANDMLVSERNYGNKRLEGQRKEFANSINQMTEKNIEASDELRGDFARSTKNLIETNRREKYNEAEELKDQFFTKLNTNTKSFEQKIEERDKDINSLAKFYDNKLNVLGRKSAKELENQRILSEERHIADQRNFKREMDTREELNQEEMKNLKESFAKNLNKVRTEQDNRTNRLVNDYEELLVLQQQQNDKTLGLKMAEARDNYDKLLKQSELQREAVKSQYESRMEKMRAVNTQSVDLASRAMAKKAT